ncbi:unnamed protein product [Camellia sinensis]
MKKLRLSKDELTVKSDFEDSDRYQSAVQSVFEDSDQFRDSGQFRCSVATVICTEERCLKDWKTERYKEIIRSGTLLALCNCKEDVRKKVHSVIEKFAERGLRSLAVARQEVPEKTKDSPGAPWQFVGYCLYLIHLGMMVQTPSKELSILE